MNRTPRSRTIELISLNTSRGVWNWRIVWESPKVNVASRRPCASSTGLRFAIAAVSGAFAPPFEGAVSGAFSTALLSAFLGGGEAGLDSSFFQNLKGIPGRRSSGRVIRFAARESGSGRKHTKNSCVLDPALAHGAQGIHRDASRRVRAGKGSRRALDASGSEKELAQVHRATHGQGSVRARTSILEGS